MTRRDLFKSMFWAPVIAVAAVVEEVYPPKEIEPLDLAIREKRIVSGEGGYVKDSKLNDCCIELGLSGQVTGCSFSLGGR